MLVAIAAACSNPSKLEQQSTASGSGSGSDQMPRVKRYQKQAWITPPQAIEIPKQESFVVLDPGKGARKQLRYALADGIVEHRVETRLSSRQLDKGKLGEPSELAIRDGFAITIAKDEPLAVRPLPGEIVGKASPLAEQYLSTWRTQLANRRLNVTLDARGQFSGIQFKDDPTNVRSARAKDELVQRLLATIVPLPEPAVGTGARWQVITVLRQGPAYIKQTATYTLVERTPTKWKLKVKLLRVGEEQTVRDPALPAGATVDLIALFRLLEGDLELDPKRPLIARGSFSVESRLHAKLTLPGQPPAEQFVEDLGTVTFTSAP
jgi:hypothetical protein